MVFTDSFKDAVEEGNVRKIRIMLKDSLLVDPTFSEFCEMEQAARKVHGLYDEHDGREFEENEDRWDDEYMNKLMVQVVGNFSRERVDHLKDVVQKLRPVTKRTAANGKANSTIKDSHHNYSKSSYQKPQQPDKASGDYSKGRIAGGLVIGGIAGGVLGAAASMVIPPLVACAIGGMVIGGAAGGVTAYCTSERK